MEVTQQESYFYKKAVHFIHEHAVSINNFLYLRKRSCKLRNGTLRNLTPLLWMIFAEASVVCWVSQLTSHNAPASDAKYNLSN